MHSEALSKQLKTKLSKNPTNTNVINQLAIAEMESHGYIQAYKLFKKAAEIAPTIHSLTNLGYFYLHEGEPNDDGSFSNAASKAIDLLEQAISLKPKSKYPYSLLGEAYLIIKNYGKAEEVLKKAVAIKGDYANRNNLGVALYKQGQPGEAANCFLAAHEKKHDDGSYRPYLNYGVCLAQLGEFSEAEHVAEFLLSSQDDNIDFLDISQIYYETLNYSKVIKLFEAYTYSWSLDWAVFYLYSLNRYKQDAKAVLVLKEAISKINEVIDEISKDKDDDWTEDEREERIKDLTKEIYRYKEEFARIKSGYRPPINFEPYIESKCYLFGCHRHNNPEY